MTIFSVSNSAKDLDIPCLVKFKGSMIFPPNRPWRRKNATLAHDPTYVPKHDMYFFWIAQNHYIYYIIGIIEAHLHPEPSQ